jgi:hypothetical protein
VDPCLMCHVSPGFSTFHRPYVPIKHVTCVTHCRGHVSSLPCLRVSSLALTCLVHLVGGVFGTHLYSVASSTSPHVRGWTLRESGTSGLQRFGMQCQGKLKGPKVEPRGEIWDPSGVRELGLWRTCVQKRKGMFKCRSIERRILL